MRSWLVAIVGALEPGTEPLQKLFAELMAADDHYRLTEAEQAEHLSHFIRLFQDEASAKEVFAAAVPVHTQALLDDVSHAGWTAGPSPHFAGWAIGDAAKLMGSPLGDAYMPLPARDVTPAWEGEVPASFDARTQWASCPSVSHIRDQASCGSCWAFGSTEAFNDRLCIASQAKFTTLLSVQHTTSCCGFLSCFSMGCNGGQPGRAWHWLVSHGVVTGGDYPDLGKTDTCWPYELPMCSHHVNSSMPACKEGGSTPKCRTSCANEGYTTPFAKDIHNAPGGKAYSLGSVDEIKQSLVAKGPVTAAFTVYADFLTYKSGVYEHTTGSQLGGHAIRIFGYGTEDGKDYWMVANSWNEDWGDKGTFKIKMGDSGIESQVSAGDVESLVPLYV